MLLHCIGGIFDIFFLFFSETNSTFLIRGRLYSRIQSIVNNCRRHNIALHQIVRSASAIEIFIKSLIVQRLDRENENTKCNGRRSLMIEQSGKDLVIVAQPEAARGRLLFAKIK